VSKSPDSGGEDFGGNDEGCCVKTEVEEKLENFVSSPAFDLITAIRALTS
jgi:hypothetical protein